MRSTSRTVSILSTNTLKVGDTVSWRGAWGNQASSLARVKSIDLVEPGEKHGYQSVEEVDWSRVPTEVVVDLDNGHWAYGRHITELEDDTPPWSSERLDQFTRDA